MRIKQATASDTLEVTRLDTVLLGRSARCEFLTEAIQKHQVWIAHADDRLAGYTVCTRSFFGYPFIDILMVDTPFCRRGIGSALMTTVESACPPGKLFTSTNESNIKMQRLCESLGFMRSGWIENLDEGDPEIVYFKRV